MHTLCPVSSEAHPQLGQLDFFGGAQNTAQSVALTLSALRQLDTAPCQDPSGPYTPLPKPVELSQILRSLSADLLASLPRQQPLMSDAFRCSDTGIRTLQEKMIIHHWHLVRDGHNDHQDRDQHARATQWIEVLIWFAYPPQSLRCRPPLSFQSCCEACVADFETARKGFLTWIAASLGKGASRGPGSFWGLGRRRGLDSRALGIRLLRAFEPGLLRPAHLH